MKRKAKKQVNARPLCGRMCTRVSHGCRSQPCAAFGESHPNRTRIGQLRPSLCLARRRSSKRRLGPRTPIAAFGCTDAQLRLHLGLSQRRAPGATPYRALRPCTRHPAPLTRQNAVGFRPLAQLWSEAGRIATFEGKWPFTQKRAKANAEKMAAAGFYYTGDEAFEDNVTCFMCAKVGAP